QSRDAADDMLGYGEVERLLAAEVIDDRGQVGASLLGDLPRGGALEAEPPEDVERCVDQPLPCLGAAVALRTPVVPRVLDVACRASAARLRPNAGRGGSCSRRLLDAHALAARSIHVGHRTYLSTYGAMRVFELTRVNPVRHSFA